MHPLRCLQWWIINATDEALKLGNPAFANVILLGALVGANVLPLDKESVEPVLREEFPTQVDANLVALSKGIELMEQGG